MRATQDYGTRILNCLKRFIKSTGREHVDLRERSNLIQQVGMTSDEGVDFVLDLCKEFAFEFPNDFNPFIEADGRRGRTVRELIAAVESQLRAQEVAR